MSNGERPPEPRWLFYVLSFVIPLAGIIIGAIYMGKAEPECKTFGKNCLIAAISCIVAICLCYVIYIFFIIGIAGMSAWVS
jgi:hypothetical protein